MGPVVVPIAFGLFLTLSIIVSSSYLLQGLGEEKENRLIEVLLSSVSSRQLLAGKVLGIGAAGLVQVVVWLLSMLLLLNLASSTFGGFISTLEIPANLLLLGIVYFVLGYLFFAVLFSAIGAISPTMREGQQLSSIFTMMAVSPLWFTSLLLLYPDSPVWVVLTIFPFTAPVLVMARLGLTGVPAWELAASISVLFICVVGGILLAAKLFRIYLLTYGKRPSLGQIARRLRSG